jgi:hypothetical protein
MKSCILTPLLAFALIAPAHGALLLSENFDSLNSGALGGQSQWSAVTGVNVTAGGLGYSNGDITIAGGANRVESNLVSTGVDAPLTTNSFAAQSGEVWFSFTMRIASSAANSRYWFWVSDTTSINSGVTGAVANSNTGNQTIFSEIRINTSASPTGITTEVDGDTYFFVARLSKDGNATNTNAYDRMEVWLNPASITLSGGIIANAPVSASITGGIANFGLTTLTSAATIQWDNLLVGTSQADVLDVYASTIPEPSTFALLGGIGALGFAGLRRRKRA